MAMETGSAQPSAELRGEKIRGTNARLRRWCQSNKPNVGVTQLIWLLLQNVTANHRVNDVIATEDGPQTLVGRFMYGPLDMVTLTGEKARSVGLIISHTWALSLTFDLPLLLQVDIFLMTQPQSGHWVHFDTEMTNSSGRVTYSIPKSKRMGLGVYPIKMVVK